MKGGTKRWMAGLVGSLLIAPAVVRLTANVAECLEQDSRQTKNGLVSMVWIAIFSLPLLIVAWACICAMIFLWLLTWTNTISALMLLLGVHLLLLLNIVILLSRTREKMGFTNTRNYIRRF